jgi:hypothetical protein
MPLLEQVARFGFRAIGGMLTSERSERLRDEMIYFHGKIDLKSSGSSRGNSRRRQKSGD